MNKTIISFTHTNYCIRSAGTEKFVRNLSVLLQKEDYHHLNFFSFYSDSRLCGKMVGVNYDDVFQGVFKYDDIYKIICDYSYRFDLCYTAIHLQHLLNHDLGLIQKIIIDLKIPVYTFVHDYYMVCENLKLISNGAFCGLTLPDERKCSGCEYKENALAHRAKFEDFLEQIKPWTACFFAPSDYVTDHFKKMFPEYANKIFTRPHLTCSGLVRREQVNHKVKIAFAGGQHTEKGFELWKTLVESLNAKTLAESLDEKSLDGKIADFYEFYYLGNGMQKLDGVKNIYVSNAEQGEDAMVDALHNNGIDCTFLWPLLPETYSYVFYENLINGVYCVTNAQSGNIADAVRHFHNGMVFQDFEECMSWFQNPEHVIKTINQFRDEIKVPSKTETNRNIANMTGHTNTYSCDHKTNVHPWNMHTMIYKMKYKKLL